MEQIVFIVWGGYPEEECSDHWGTFETQEDAERYVAEQVRQHPRVILHIRRSEVEKYPQ